MARIRQSKALRRTVESVVRCSIELAVRSTSAANVIEYSYRRARRVSTRKSDRISGQGLMSACSGLLSTLVQATTEQRARPTAVRINNTRQAAIGLTSARLSAPGRCDAGYQMTRGERG